MVIGIIPARGGSKGVPKKNIRMVHGKPLIGYAIECGLRSKVLDKVIVSTDSIEIAEIAKTLVPFIRPAELALDNTPTMPVLEHAVMECERLFGETVDPIVLIDPTAPLRTPEDIIGALSLYREAEVDAVISASLAKRNPYFNMVQIASDGYVELVAKSEKKILRRQDAPVVYDLNTVCWVFSRMVVLGTRERLPKKTKVFVVPEERSFDLDTALDFEMLDLFLEKGGMRV
jgi:CMP-N,N'-diacetyllegionaminic acid synthase